MKFKKRIDERVSIAAPANVVWDKISDHESTPLWVTRGLTRVTIREPGPTHANGLGAIRAVKFRGWPEVLERIVAFEPVHSFQYKLIKGMPHVADHLGTLELTSTDSTRTELRWHIDFEFHALHPLSWTAPLFIRLFRKIVAAGLAELRRQIEATPE